MCLILFSWQPDHQHPLVLLANRDENYQRPSLPVHFWEEHPHILGGRDIEAGGGWLAADTQGRLAAVTNYREPHCPKAERSRGELVSQFLSGTLSAPDYLTMVQERSRRYAGFNLLLLDKNQLYYYSNRTEQQQHKLLKPGTYGLCNHLLDTPWPKLLNTRNHFSQLLEESELPHQPLIQVMRDENKAPDHRLPDTGVGIERERHLSSPFIAGNQYGTRNTSLLVFHQNSRLEWFEQHYLPEGKPGAQQSFKLEINA